MKTIEEQKNLLINDTQRKLVEINKFYINNMRAMEIAQNIMDEIMPVMKKLHMPYYNEIHVGMNIDTKQANISLSMIPDDKFKFYKRSYCESNWWKKNKSRIDKKVEKITDSIIKSCNKYEIKAHVNEYSLINEDGRTNKHILVNIGFEVLDENSSLK